MTLIHMLKKIINVYKHIFMFIFLNHMQLIKLVRMYT